MHYLTFDLSEEAEGVATLEAMASTSTEQHVAVMTEVRQVLDWAWQHFPHTHGPVDDGMDWDHLHVNMEDGHWHVVTFTLAGSQRFVEELLAAFCDPLA